MKVAPFAFALVLLPSLASAVPIIPPMPQANCVLEEVVIEHPHVEDLGWAWLQQLLGLSDAEIAQRKAEDLLHEPAPEVPVFAWNCPGGCRHQGGAGPTGGAGSSNNVPEPTVLSLLLLGGMAWFGLRRGAPRREVER